MKTVGGNVCCQHVRRPCSLRLRAFPAIHIVFRCNNGSVVYPRGDFGVKTYKSNTALTRFLLTLATDLKLRLQEKGLDGMRKWKEESTQRLLIKGENNC